MDVSYETARIYLAREKLSEGQGLGQVYTTWDRIRKAATRGQEWQWKLTANFINKTFPWSVEKHWNTKEKIHLKQNQRILSVVVLFII